MSPIFFIIAAIFVISSIAEKSRQKKNTDEARQKKPHPAFEAEREPEAEAPVLRRVVRPSVSHTVKPFTESEHAHTESSITGIEECENEYAVPEVERTDAVNAPEAQFNLKLDAENAALGILYSEILGKPKALRR